jgi:uncharacterized protein (TIGR03792 family)
MVVEWLNFIVPPELQADFVAQDRAVWTEALSTCPGFLDKSVWREANAPEKLSLVIRWRTREDWRAVPAPLIANANERFEAALGQRFPVMQCIDYEVIDAKEIP